MGMNVDPVSDRARADASASPAADLKQSRRQKPSRADARPGIDRLPPHSSEAEQGVLGCVLLSPNECMGQCIEKLKGDGHQVFYDLRHQTLYENLALMYDAREAIDVITLQQRLKDQQLLDQIGGIAYLGQLQDAVPSAANLSFYLEILQEKFLLRRMIATCTGVVGRVYDYQGDVETLLDEGSAQAAEVVTNTPEEFRKFIIDEIAMTGKAVRAAGLTAE